MKIFRFLPLFLLIGTASFGQDTDPLKEVLAQGEKGKAQFQEFYAQFIEPHGSPSRQQVLDAAYALTQYLNSKGIYSTVISTERHPDWVRVRILPKRDWEKTIPLPGIGETKKSAWMQLAESGKSPAPHVLCQMADDLFWKCEVTVEFYYYFGFATDPKTDSHIGDYVWDGEYNNHRQIVLLPPNLFSAPIDQLDRQPGFIFGLVQHDFHNKRVTRQQSPFHAYVNEKELARIPAYLASIDRIVEKLVVWLSVDEKSATAKDGEKLIQELRVFSSKGLQEAEAASATVTRIEDAYRKRDIFPKFEANLDSTVFGALELDKAKARFYLVSLENPESPDTKSALDAQILKVKGGLADAIQTLNKYAPLVTALESPTLSRAEKLRRLQTK